MTIIAFRDGIAAADSEIHIRDFRAGLRRKLWRLRDGSRVAIVGDMVEAIAIAAWIEKGRPGPMPRGGLGPEDAGMAILFAKRGPPILHYLGLTAPAPRARFYAWGAGAEVAMGAFWQGATAKEAVRAAVALHTLCGGPVRVMAP